jgi:hypothetical protein
VIDDGGSPLLSYSLEISEGEGGPFTALYGDIVDSMILSYTYRQVERGLTYRCRYRVKNTIGWSFYSPVGYLLASSVPSQPNAPEYFGATDT